jgi:hypothetical protein
MILPLNALFTGGVAEPGAGLLWILYSFCRPQFLPDPSQAVGLEKQDKPDDELDDSADQLTTETTGIGLALTAFGHEIDDCGLGEFGNASGQENQTEDAECEGLDGVGIQARRKHGLLVRSDPSRDGIAFDYDEQADKQVEQNRAHGNRDAGGIVET